jgi:choline kinase
LKCVIIAAGRGSRLGGRSESKPLLLVKDRALIEWVILAAYQAGIRDFLIVTGYSRERLEQYLNRLARAKGIRVSFVHNDEWEKENGLSVFKAKEPAGEEFVLLMADHIFDPGILAKLIVQPIEKSETILAVDFNVRSNPLVDLDDVTKVMVEEGKIAKIGKEIMPYNAFDTGIFLCTSSIFNALEESQKRGDYSLSGGLRVLVESRKARVMDIDGGFWIDVDDEKALEKAESVLMLRG